MEFEVRVEYPPNIQSILNEFKVSKEFIEKNGVVFTYGIVLYNPAGRTIPHHLMEHEKVHQKQQLAIGIEEWWAKYLKDKDFRLAQELEAYRTQYQFIKERVTNKIAKDVLTQLSLDMSSELYGNMIEYSKAENLIRKFNQ